MRKYLLGAAQDLSRFDLDRRGFTVARVLVNGRVARCAAT